MNRRVAQGLAYALLILVCIVILLPYFIMLITSIKTRTEVFAFPPHWFPAHLDLSNFPALFTKYGFGHAFLASLIACGGSTVLALLISIPAAYAIARLRFRGRRWIIYVFLVAQMFAPVVIIVGLFRVIVFYHLLDSLLSLVLTYAAFNLAFNIWMLSSFFETIPPDIEEAAWIDGATRWGAIRSVFVPLALPGMTVAFLFSFVAAWNDLVLALSFIRSSEKFPVTLSVFNLVSGRYTVEWQVVMAAVILATLPVVIMFGSVQRYFIQGFTAGAIK